MITEIIAPQPADSMLAYDARFAALFTRSAAGAGGEAVGGNS
jgi:hypothetical protein